MDIKKGQLISVEGVNGADNVISLEHIVETLKQAGVENVVLTREPGGTELGEALRELVLHKGSMSIETEILLMVAARAEHVNKIILPSLSNGDWVVTDRFSDSTYAFQSYGRGFDLASIKKIEEIAFGVLVPDLTLLFNLPTGVVMDRVGRTEKPDRFESEERAFHERVRYGYLELSHTSDRFKVIDNSEPLEVIFKRVGCEIKKFVNATRG